MRDDKKYAFYKKNIIEKDDYYDFDQAKQEKTRNNTNMMQRTKKELCMFTESTNKFIVPSGVEYYETKTEEEIKKHENINLLVNRQDKMPNKSLLQPYKNVLTKKNAWEESGFVTPFKTKNIQCAKEKIRTKHEKGVFTSMENDKKILVDVSEKEGLQKLIQTGIAPQKDMVVESKMKDLAPRRMCNKSNNCFFNSTMQVILSFTEFVSFYMYNNKLQGKISVAFKNFIERYKNNDLVDPDTFIRSLKGLIPILDGNEQDAHEFLVYFLHILYCELGGSTKALGDEKNFETAKAENIIARVFFGMQKNITKCVYCEHESVRYEEFINLTLPLNDTIRQSYEDYIKVEYLDNYMCSECKKCRKCTQRVEICKLPSILILHLRRFANNKHKNSKKMAIEAVMHIEGHRYKLVGLIKHHGFLNNGHYISEAIRDNYWWHFDDTTVYKLDSIDLCKSDAYILFYSLL
ncbi:Ubiquitin carboxyl-terminal hydrolase 8 [Binucleata daphniae]